MNNPVLTEQQQALLLALVDGTLESELIADAEQLLANNSAAARFVAELESSDLDFKSAFAPLLDIPVPAKTLNLITSPDIAATSNNKGSTAVWRYAAVLVMGTMIGLGLNQFEFGNEPTEQVTSGEIASSWVDQVANYQQLYVRPTVENAASMRPDDLQEMITNKLGQSVTIPDLSASNIQFKRGQPLEVNGQPLIQLAYLPDQGLPVAFCIMRDADANDTEPSFGKSHGMQYGTWNKNGLKFVMVGKFSASKIEQLTLTALEQVSHGV